MTRAVFVGEGWYKNEGLEYLVKGDDVRSATKANARHSWLQAAPESSFAHV